MRPWIDAAAGRMTAGRPGNAVQVPVPAGTGA